MDDLRTTLAANLKALMDNQVDRNGLFTSSRSVAKKAGVNKNTVQRLLKPDELNSLPAVDTLDAIAKVFGLRAWQLLIPGLQPSNPPVVSLTQAERDLYERLTDVAKQVVQQHEQGVGHGPDQSPDRVPGSGKESATDGPAEKQEPRPTARPRR